MSSTTLQAVLEPPARALTQFPEPSNPDLVVDPLIDRFDLFYLLRRRWFHLLLAPMAGLAAAAALYSVKEPLFESSAVVLVDPSFEEIIQFENLGGGRDDDLPGLRSLQIAMVADSVILRVIDRLGLRDDPGFLPEDLAAKPDLSDSELVDFLRDHRIDSSLQKGTRLIRISVLDPDPVRAQRIAEAFATEFGLFISDQRRDEVQHARAILEKQAHEARLAALAAEEKLSEFRESSPDFPVEQDNDLVNTRLTQLGEELNAVTQERRQLENQRSILANLDADMSPMDIIEVAQYREFAHVSELLSAITASQTRLGVVSERYLEKHPTYITALREVERNEEQLRQLARNIVAAIDAKYHSAKLREADLSKALSEGIASLGRVKTSSSEFRALQEQAERDWRIHETLQVKLTESAVSTEIAGQISTMVSKPMLPHKKAEPDLPVYMALGGGLGTMVSAGWLLLAIVGGLPVSHPRQLEQRFGVPILADWSEPESVRDPARSTRFLHHLGTTSDQTIQISTTVLEDGTESVAREIARIASLNGKKTLLIVIKSGATLRKPAPSEHPDLLVLEVPPDAVRDLRRFPAGLEKVRESFDVILFDASGARDPELVNFLSSYADLDLVIVRKDATKKQDIEERVAKLRRGGRSPVALVMVPPDSSRRG